MLLLPKMHFGAVNISTQVRQSHEVCAIWHTVRGNPCGSHHILLQSTLSPREGDLPGAKFPGQGSRCGWVRSYQPRAPAFHCHLRHTFRILHGSCASTLIGQVLFIIVFANISSHFPIPWFAQSLCTRKLFIQVIPKVVHQSFVVHTHFPPGARPPIVLKSPFSQISNFC